MKSLPVYKELSFVVHILPDYEEDNVPVIEDGFKLVENDEGVKVLEKRINVNMHSSEQLEWYAYEFDFSDYFPLTESLLKPFLKRDQIDRVNFLEPDVIWEGEDTIVGNLLEAKCFFPPLNVKTPWGNEKLDPLRKLIDMYWDAILKREGVFEEGFSSVFEPWRKLLADELILSWDLHCEFLQSALRFVDQSKFKTFDEFTNQWNTVAHTNLSKKKIEVEVMKHERIGVEDQEEDWKILGFFFSYLANRLIRPKMKQMKRKREE